MSKKNYNKQLNTKYYKNFAKFYSSAATGSTSNPYCWFTNENTKCEKNEIKNLIDGWKCFLEKNTSSISISCESKKTDCGLYVSIVATINYPIAEYWMNLLSTDIKNDSDENDDIDIVVSIKSGEKNIEKAMDVFFFSGYGMGLSASMKKHKKLFDILTNIGQHVEKIKSRIIMEKMSDGRK